MKRLILSLFLVVCFVFSTLPVSVLASTNSASVYAVADKTTVSPGDTLTVTFKADNLSVDGKELAKGFQFRFDYDDTVLEYTSKENGDLLKKAQTKSISTKTSGQIGVFGVYDKLISESGDIATITFTVKASASAGDIMFELLNSTGEVSLTFGTVPVVKVETASIPRIKVSADKTKVTRGDKVTYFFDIPEVEDFRGIEFDFDYDETKLEYVDCEEGDIISNGFVSGINDADGIVKVFVAYDEAVTVEGNICTIQLMVKNNVMYGDVTNTVSGLKASCVLDTENISNQLSIVPSAADSDAANAVIELIDSIGTVTIDSGNAISEAENAYDALNDAQKTLITNYDELTAARAAYDKIAADYAAADVVKALINAIEEPVTKESKDAIEAAEAAYNALTDDQKAYVTNIDSLVQKRTAYDAIKTVTFNLNYTNSEPFELYVSAGQLISAPNPSRDGYTFGGWYKDAETTEKWDFGKNIIEEDITLYAKWEQKTTGGSLSVSGISFSVSLNGNTNVGTVWAAVYDSIGKAISVKQYPAADTVNVVFDAGVAGDYVKIMWWNNIVPMCEAQIIPLH